MTKSERITEHILRAVAAPIAGLFGAVVALVLSFLLLALMEWLGCHALVLRLARMAASIAMGFAFVFVGSLVATTTWRVRAACMLLGLGILFYLCLHYYAFPDTDSERGSGVSVWAVSDFAVTIAGGLLAVAVLHFRKHEEAS
jgi:hypothetical protein